MTLSEPKKRIINATIYLLKSKSMKEISMRNIAKEAGVTTGSIYHHYKNKDELLMDVMEESLLFTPKLNDLVKKDNFQEKGITLLEEVNFQVGERIRKVEQQKLHIQFLTSVMKNSPEMTEVYKQTYRKIMKSTNELMLNAYDKESSDLTKVLSSVLVAAIDGVALQQTLGVLPEDIEKYIGIFTDFFTKSLTTYLNQE